MKKLIFIFAILFSLSAFSQIDTTIYTIEIHENTIILTYQVNYSADSLNFPYMKTIDRGLLDQGILNDFLDIKVDGIELRDYSYLHLIVQKFVLKYALTTYPPVKSAFYNKYTETDQLKAYNLVANIKSKI